VEKKPEVDKIIASLRRLLEVAGNHPDKENQFLFLIGQGGVRRIFDADELKGT